MATDRKLDKDAAVKEEKARKGINKWFAWVKNTPLVLIVLGMGTVATCCLCSQWFVTFSKQSNLKLNRYYKRKRKENRRMLTDLVEAQINQSRATADVDTTNV